MPLFRLVVSLLALLPLHGLLATPLISEFSAAGQGLVLDDDDDFPDWIEIHNPDAEAYALTAHFLTDDPNNLTKWSFPRGETLRPDARLVLHASRKNRTNIFQGATHTNFALEPNRGFLAIVADDGETILHQWEDYPKQRPNITYGIGSDGEAGYLPEPTPGEPNGVARQEVVKDTKFSVNRGFHTEPVSLTITSATEGARIYVTLDGSEPSPDNGTPFSEPIAIDGTTIVRAIAMKDGLVSTNIDTHTYIYLSSILTQPEDPNDFPPRWGNVSADYAFDTSVGTDEEFETALLGYPSISLVMPIDSWFDPSRVDGEGGIYANSLERGLDWEKPISAEFINFEGSSDTQVDCGIRVYGNASRQTSRPKHNMRLAFRARYGDAKLDFPVFGKGKATGINGLLFNGQNGDSWFHPAIGQREAASYIRDHFAHELLGDMGHLTPPQARAHLYVNGLYWGFYQTVERVDHQFMARLLGGEPEEYDSMKASLQTGPTLVAGNTRAYDDMFEVANDGVEDAEGYIAIQQYLDLDSFIDYMLINFWSGNRDWDGNNWRSGRHRSEGSPWHYFMWDSENIFKDAAIDRTGNNTADNPTRLHQQLSKNANYRLKFADHIQKHLFNDGLLTEKSVKARWERWANYIRPGLKAESARWGDHHRPGRPHTVEEDFEEAFQGLMTSLFPARAKNSLRHFKNRDLYPSDILPIEFNQHGGLIDPGFTLTMSAGSIFQPQEGDIHYTLDGSDPMEGLGQVYESAVPLEASATVKARIQDGDGEWSMLTEARFTLGQTPQAGELVLSEIHYHPAEPTASENPEGRWSRTDFEFVEVWNTTDRVLQLSGLVFDEGIRFAFPEQSLAPDARALIVEDLEAFTSRYGSVTNVLGAYQGQLANGGEQVTLRDADGEILHTVFFDDESPWPAEPDGQGSSLILTNPEALEDSASWAQSPEANGSPGIADGVISTELPADFAAWLGNRSPLGLHPQTQTTNLVTYALGLDLAASAGIQVRDSAVGITLREEASSWVITPEGSSDLETWSSNVPSLTETKNAGNGRQWSFTQDDAAPRYYRFRISLP